MLVSRGRIQLEMPCHLWALESMRRANLLLAPLSPAAAVEASFLPGDLHQDPADRMLVATARSTHAILATRDEKILAYGRMGHVKVLKT